MSDNPLGASLQKNEKKFHKKICMLLLPYIYVYEDKHISIEVKITVQPNMISHTYIHIYSYGM